MSELEKKMMQLLITIKATRVEFADRNLMTTTIQSSMANGDIKRAIHWAELLIERQVQIKATPKAIIQEVYSI